MKVLSVSAGTVSSQGMEGFGGDRWSGNEQLSWRDAKPRARLDLEFEVAESGTYDVEASFTTAGDYAIINVLLDKKALGQPLDLFDAPGVATTGTLLLDRRTLEAGAHILTLETVGANPAAIKRYMVGFDYLKLVPR